MTTVHSLQPTAKRDPTVVMPARDAAIRINDFYEVYADADPRAAQDEGKRCFNCGAAFCMPDSGYAPPGNFPGTSPGSSPGTLGCPIENKIPEWNELVNAGRWRDAYDRLSLTNPFPEFTSRICPAPCQDACILGINESPVQIKGIERAIIDRAFENGWVTPPEVPTGTGRHVAIIGSGPAGLAAADALIRKGHAVTVYERADRAGGLLTYGVPNMKLDKAVVARRIELLERAGVRFQLNADVGGNIDPQQLLRDHHAVLLAVGAQKARPLALPGRDLPGVHDAMPYLTASTRSVLDETQVPGSLNAAGKDVVVIGGGDTGADCVGTALRQGCRSLINITRRTPPPTARDADHPWPGPPDTFVLDYAHAEGLARTGRDPREFQVQPLGFVADESTTGGPHPVRGVRVRDLRDRSERTLPADLVLIAIGFVGHDAPPLSEAFRLVSDQGKLAGEGHRTPIAKLYTAGDCRRGASLVVWAIREGLDAARAIDHDLTRSAVR
ncbi:MAG: glutamate synthase subunit beta [Planctomycetota bacterium]